MIIIKKVKNVSDHKNQDSSYSEKIEEEIVIRMKNIKALWGASIQVLFLTKKNV